MDQEIQFQKAEVNKSNCNEESEDNQEEKKNEEVSGEEEIDYEKIIEENLNEEIERLSKPFWLSKLIVRFPIIILSSVFLFMIIMAVIVYVTGATTLTDSYYRDYLVWGSKLVNDYDLLVLTQKEVENNYSGGYQPLRTTKENAYLTFLLFEWSSWDTILTVDNLKKMYEIEQKVYTNKNFVNYCLAQNTSSSSCSSSSYLSFTKNFANINTLTQSDIDTKLASIGSSTTDYYNNNFFFENSFTQSNLKTKKARAIFLFATPIEIDGTRYKTSSDRYIEQTKKFVQFSYSIESDVFSVQTSLSVRFYNIAWREDLISSYILNDFKLIIVSFAIVFVYVSFQVQSTFLTSIKLLGMGLSFPLAIFINRYIFQITYFGDLNLVSIFIILGIATDSIFVFVDCWKQTATYKLLHLPEYSKQEIILRRMSYTWKRTSKAILTTNLATAWAFLSNGTSSIMPCSVFGYFSSVLVILVYCFAIICSPWWVVIYERYLANRWKYRAFIYNILTKLYINLKLLIWKAKCCRSKDKAGEENNQLDVGDEGWYFITVTLFH